MDLCLVRGKYFCQRKRSIQPLREEIWVLIKNLSMEIMGLIPEDQQDLINWLLHLMIFALFTSHSFFFIALLLIIIKP